MRVAIIGMFLFLAAAPAAAQAPELRPCGNPQAVGQAECGTLSVPERPGSSRRVTLDIMVLRASGSDRLPDPLFILPGGPGQAATKQADSFGEAFAPIRTRRDIWLVDPRGTGQSSSMHCSVDPAARDQLPLDSVRACRAQLSARMDLSAYTTRQIVADLEQVRRAFGLPAVNLYGTSYGTRVALEYMRLHPLSVRSAALSGVIPAQNQISTESALFAQQAFTRYAALCAANPACSAAFPDPRRDFDAAIAHVAAAHARGTTPLSPGLFAELVRLSIYSPDRVTGLFRELRVAAQGDLANWERRAASMPATWAPGRASLGQLLSVTCADFLPQTDVERARRLGRASFAGTYRMDQQRAACAVWDVRPAPADFGRAVRSAVPTLLLSGELDPITPPSGAAIAARTLGNGRSVILRNSGHGLGSASGPCAIAMIQTLIDTRDVSRVDARCAETIPTPNMTPR